MFRAHVLIIRKSKLYYTASGIITPVGGLPVQRLREDLCICALNWLITKTTKLSLLAFAIGAQYGVRENNGIHWVC